MAGAGPAFIDRPLPKSPRCLPLPSTPEAFIDHWQEAAEDTTTQDTLDLPEKKRGKKSEVRSQKSATGSTKRAAKTPWPKSLADRIRATEQALHAAKSPVTPADLTKHFSRAKPTDLQEILESLVALGRARKDGERFGV